MNIKLERLCIEEEAAASKQGKEALFFKKKLLPLKYVGHRVTITFQHKSIHWIWDLTEQWINFFLQIYSLYWIFFLISPSIKTDSCYQPIYLDLRFVKQNTNLKTCPLGEWSRTLEINSITQITSRTYFMLCATKQLDASYNCLQGIATFFKRGKRPNK